MKNNNENTNEDTNLGDPAEAKKLQQGVLSNTSCINPSSTTIGEFIRASTQSPSKPLSPDTV